MRKVDGRAVPQYFVMVGGRRRRRRRDLRAAGREGAGASRERPRSSGCSTGIAAIARTARSPQAFFGARQVPEVKALLADLESFDARARAQHDDYVDLAETQAFTPEVMEGECAT